MEQNCIVWGAGNYGRRLIPILTENGYTIKAFCDSNTKLTGVEGYKIISVEQAGKICSANRDLTVVIGIFDMAVVEEVKRTIKTEFPQNTKIQIGRDIQRSFENRMLLENYQKMIFRWKVNLEESFSVWLDHVMDEVEYHVRNDADCRGGMHEHFIRCRKNHAFTHRDVLRRVKAGDTVMDIGCGLALKYGAELESGGKVQLVPVDALAHFYNILDGRIGELKEDCRHRFGLFEFLGNQFGRNYADYIIINNALDHCIDPWRSLVECLYVLKLGGRMYLNHKRAEAVYEGWTGLHKWNIDCFHGELLIWNKENAVNVTEKLKEFAEVSVRYDDSIEIREDQNIGVEIVKKRDFELSDFLDMHQENDILTKFIDKLMEKLAADSGAFFRMLEQADFGETTV